MWSTDLEQQQQQPQQMGEDEAAKVTKKKLCWKMWIYKIKRTEHRRRTNHQYEQVDIHYFYYFSTAKQ